MMLKILEDKDKELINKYEAYVDFLLMEELSVILRNKRVKRGAIDFNFEEAKISLDEEGRAIDVQVVERNIATRIIEEFMLICNETIAEIILRGLPFYIPFSSRAGS